MKWILGYELLPQQQSSCSRFSKKERVLMSFFIYLAITSQETAGESLFEVWGLKDFRGNDRGNSIILAFFRFKVL